MPAHISAAVMRSNPPQDSSGTPITWLAWRANRLADALAKVAASEVRLPPAVFQWIRDAEVLQKHQAALLGWVTHEANHHEIEDIDAEGRSHRRVLRDSAGRRPQQPRLSRRHPQQCPTLSTAVSAASSSGPPFLGPREKRRRVAEAHDQRQRVLEATQAAQFLQSTQLRPATGPSAAERLAALRSRVLGRIAGTAACR